MSSSIPIRTILTLAANPKGTDPLRLGEEVREIRQGLRLSRNRDQFKLCQEWAVRLEDIRMALLDTNPQIVHFCGHGEGTKGLMVENESGKVQLVQAQALADFLGLFNSIECVLLNACYSEVQAEAISQHIPYVIGMSHAIGDRAAIVFSRSFYEALGSGRSYTDAYQFGCKAIDLQGIPEDQTPKIKRKKTGVSTLLLQNFAQPSPAALPLQPIPERSSQRREPISPKPFAPSRRTAVATQERFLKISKKIWTFLLVIVVAWVIVGLGSTKLDARGPETQIGLLFCGAIGGSLSGLFGAIAQRKVSPNVRLEQIFLQGATGAVAGAIGWLTFCWLIDSLLGFGFFIKNGSIFGVIAGLGAVGLILWQLSRSRA